MSAGSQLDAAHKLAAKACGKLSIMLALSKVNRAMVEAAYGELRAAVEALEPIINTPKPTPSPQPKLDTLF